tara:strand:+ start:219679 stop:219891 length:213 start_codon:yes stop_codon:yes gene_type:complete
MTQAARECRVFFGLHTLIAMHRRRGKWKSSSRALAEPEGFSGLCRTQSDLPIQGKMPLFNTPPAVSPAAE